MGGHLIWELCIVIIFKINNQSELYAAVILTMIIVLCPMRNVNDEHNVESKCVYHPLYFAVWIWLYGCGRRLCFAVLNTYHSSYFEGIPSIINSIKSYEGKPQSYVWQTISIWVSPHMRGVYICYETLRLVLSGYMYTERSYMSCAVELTLLVL